MSRTVREILEMLKFTNPSSRVDYTTACNEEIDFALKEIGELLKGLEKEIKAYTPNDPNRIHNQAIDKVREALGL